MRTRTVLEGNAFYEIDEDCMEKLQEDKKLRKNEMCAKERTGGKSECEKPENREKAYRKSEYRKSECRKAACRSIGCRRSG